jgi:hypothetical protein
MESDTARPLMSTPPPADYSAQPTAAPDQPVWPLLLLVALAALLAERLLALRGRRSSVL